MLAIDIKDRRFIQQRAYPLEGSLKNYFHPRMLPILMDAAAKSEQPSYWRMRAVLRDVTGIYCNEKEFEAVQSWWQQARPTLETKYDLATEQGISSWLDAFQQADAATQKVLFQLWLFQRNIAEDYLLNQATADEPQRADAAKAAR